MKKTIDIIERLEGEAKLHLSWNKNIVSDARIDFLNFRGYEFVLQNKSLLDALVYTPRICGICGQAHLLATVNALEDLYKSADLELEISNKAKILRDLGLIIETIDSHIKWFFMFIMPDIVKQSSKEYDEYKILVGRNWKESQRATSELIKALAIYAGQWPHTSYMIPGGVMADPTRMDMINCEAYIDQVIKYFENNLLGISLDEYLSFNKFEDCFKMTGAIKDFIEISFETGLDQIGKSFNKFLILSNSHGYISGYRKEKTIRKIDFDKILEQDIYTFDKNDREKRDAHTWAKRVEYNGEAFEVGPLARAMVSGKAFIKDINKKHDDSVFTRVIARMDEVAYLLNYAKEILKELDITEPSFIKPKIEIKQLDGVKGRASIEACRGSLYHEIEASKGKIVNYNIITPTVWNLGPQSNKELGIAQNAIIGSKSLEEATIILRSYDVCSVCTTH